jgi:type VI secretion system secreted protein VgrG
LAALTTHLIEFTARNFTRYNLTLEPWTAFLARGRDSRIFQDMAVFDILDAIFSRYQGQGKLAPTWRFDILDRALYPKRSIATQYQESDLAFAERLMSEEGLFYYFEHSGDAASPGLGSHTMVIADHNGSFKPNAQAGIAFTQPGAVMKRDSMDRWRLELRQQTNAIEISSWDYRSLSHRPRQTRSKPPSGNDISYRRVALTKPTSGANLFDPVGRHASPVPATFAGLHSACVLLRPAQTRTWHFSAAGLLIFWHC